MQVTSIPFTKGSRKTKMASLAINAVDSHFKRNPTVFIFEGMEFGDYAYPQFPVLFLCIRGVPPSPDWKISRYRRISVRIRLRAFNCSGKRKVLTNPKSRKISSILRKKLPNTKPSAARLHNVRPTSDQITPTYNSTLAQLQGDSAKTCRCLQCQHHPKPLPRLLRLLPLRLFQQLSGN